MVHLSVTFQILLQTIQTPVVVGGTSDTLDIEIQTQTGTTTGGKVRVYAVLMDISDNGSMTADEVDRDTLA